MMQQVQVSFAQLAQFALSVMDKASVTADDQSLALVQASRQFLRGIQSGQYVVSEAPTPVAETPPPPALTRAQRRARGIEGVQPAAQAIRGAGVRGAEGVLSESITGSPK